MEEENLISEEEIEILKKLDRKIESDEDYQALGEIFDEDE